MKTGRVIYRTIRTLAAIGAILALGGCIMQPADDDVGAVSLSVSGLSGSSVTASGTLDGGANDIIANAARVWLYNNGVEYDLGGEGYAEITTDGGTVTIEDIPQGPGYSVVVVIGKRTDESFQPIKYAQSTLFTVSGGRETVISPSSVALLDKVASVTYPDDLLGEELTSVVRIDDGSNAAVVSANESTVYVSSDGGDTFSSITTTGTGTIYSITKGSDLVNPNVETAYINAANGIYPLVYNGSNAWGKTALSDGIAASMIDADDNPVDDVTFSGSFVVDGTDLIVFYQRYGGLGAGLIDTTTWANDASQIEWNDIGNTDDFEPFATDESPVRAQATSGESVGYFATMLGTFRLDEGLFEGDDIEITELLDPKSDTSGIRFFGVPFPGASRSMRIDEMVLIDDDILVVGTPRGAFWFESSALDDLTGTGLVKASKITTITEVAKQPVISLVQTPGYIAVVTDETLLVRRTDDPNAAAVLNVPTRVAVLGEPADIFFDTVGTEQLLYVAGSEGLTVITLE